LANISREALYIKNYQTFKNVRLSEASFVFTGKGKVGSTSMLLSPVPVWMQFPHYYCAVQSIVFAGVLSALNKKRICFSIRATYAVCVSQFMKRKPGIVVGDPGPDAKYITLLK
jgi:hypothetical protein